MRSSTTKQGGDYTHGSSKEGYAEEGRSEEGRSQEGFPQEVSVRACKALREDLRTPAGFEPGRGFRFQGPESACTGAERGKPSPPMAIDWKSVSAGLDERGFAPLPGLLSPNECDAVAKLYDDDARFRSRIVMAAHGFGSGEYKYFAYPLPEPVRALRRSLYAPLARVANRWNEALGVPDRYPPRLEAYLARCRAAGQMRPTPLVLAYEAGDYNCLHQDLYGEHVFPLQATFLLCEAGRDFTGGELTLTEQRPRMQSRPIVVPLGRGDGVVFPVRYRPVGGKRGYYRVNVRHGVSRVRSGRRDTLGVIFHDAA